MIDRKLLLSDLQKQVKNLERDLQEQAESVEEVRLKLRGEYDHAFKVGRTAATWAAWRDERVTQVAVAWVLGTVFVRFCEDNGLLLDPYLAGPGDRLVLAEEAEAQFFRDHPDQTLRDWLHQGFDAIASTQAGKSLFDGRHNPLYQIPLSHDAAKELIAFWRRRTEQGDLVHRFRDELWDTRFLGDLYQDLSEYAKKTYALLQTPEFVEEFILDLTLTPAIEEFGHDVVKMIDPTCGSGHFVLGAFHRLLKEWEQHAPNRDPHERVRLALDAVHGVDINPFAVAIARFRLLVAALRASGVKTLADSAGYSFPMHLAIGDALIRHRQLALFEETSSDPANFHYVTEDVDEHPSILQDGRYHAVVGNPPYIAVADSRLSEIYRANYSACAGAYTLSVPFAQRFFQLAKRSSIGAHGYVGQITANSFMRQNFGKRLIEQFLGREISLSHVIDTSGAYLPGHGTPTVILVGRPRGGSQTEAVRVALGIRGEPGTPNDPSKGVVWSAIVGQIDAPGSLSDWIEVADIPRERLSRHPWSLSGGGASEVKLLLDSAPGPRLGDLVEIGTSAVPREHEAFGVGAGPLRRSAIPDRFHKALLGGESIRDWMFPGEDVALWPYDVINKEPVVHHTIEKYLWPARVLLARRMVFGETQIERGLPWTAYSMFFARRFGGLSISFPVVSTGNNFALDREERVFKQSAPVIKVLDGSSEDDYLRLLGLLNSSTACFWLKQVSHNKGSTVDSRGARQTTIPWEDFYEFTGTKLQEFPLPSAYPLELSREIDGLAQRLATVTPAAVAASGVPTRERLYVAEREWHSVRSRMIALQEELDWQVYSLYGLLDEELTAPAGSVPELTLGERAFEIVLARKMAAGEAETQWFARHGSTPITELPAHWSDEYRAVVERRIAVIEGNRNIGLIERPECKRRWATDGWDEMQRKALRDWLLDRCEARELWYHHVDGLEQPRPLTTAQLADELRRDADVLTVAGIYAPGQDLGKVIADLVADEHVPHLAALRYKDSGLSKRADWEHVWDLQRQEDALPDEATKREFRKQIPVPPKYTSADFLKGSYWKHRGKLDVPKERFVSYPGASRDGDPSLLIGWAGWDHREQAQALATLIVAREQEDGWAADRLVPLVAGLREILPWVRQWHGEFDLEWGASPADIYVGFLAETTNRLHLTDEALTSWRPPKATRGRKAKA
ncbi:BREX-2 system adenine-specific DNA-methyltransferase PglX [Micromonospora sp. WMMC415]|uniref:BREX-2 system adenine-specific DNA-methyltransferase PglX n=1 Tax=Micromonospora sp. WMMC415 TaxID=2675222 RepID=UPI0012B4D7DA|nr:BREX-2 system adenine-specific DNA-methyltransferase PglX [Micromonospora sp. WMMC415]QGN48435.1 BREX-2 system adenine-specific DNA-methyltransferase PglX [Micromonospora sp. WMMC415]